jgi:hypothetical protein
MVPNFAAPPHKLPNFFTLPVYNGFYFLYPYPVTTNRKILPIMYALCYVYKRDTSISPFIFTDVFLRKHINGDFDMPLDAGIVDSVTNANFKAMAEMQVTNALQHQNRMNAIFESSIGQIVNKMNVLDPTEAASVATVTEAGLAEAISQLGGAVAGIQQMLKGAQTTLPDTGQG